MQGRVRVIVRSVVVAAVAISPLAALSADAAVNTGAASASGPGISIENTGGNVEFGTGHSESHVVLGNPSDAPALAAPNALSTNAAPIDPGASAQARAAAIVAAAKARAQAQIDEARREADEAVARAEQQANDAKAHSDQQSQDARAHAEQSSASASSSSSSSD